MGDSIFKPGDLVRTVWYDETFMGLLNQNAQNGHDDDEDVYVDASCPDDGAYVLTYSSTTDIAKHYATGGEFSSHVQRSEIPYGTSGLLVIDSFKLTYKKITSLWYSVLHGENIRWTLGCNLVLIKKATNDGVP